MAVFVSREGDAFPVSDMESKPVALCLHKADERAAVGLLNPGTVAIPVGLLKCLNMLLRNFPPFFV